MKILEIIGCLLAIIVVSYAYDFERVVEFFTYLYKCSETLNETLITSRLSPELIICALQMDGQIFDNEGVMQQDAMRKFITDVTPNESEVESSWHVFDICCSNADILGFTSTLKLTYVFSCFGPIVCNLYV
ncbi:uncharacterized protein LOC116853080 isoform X2 [Odontomachus brunneus]|uniref:uncharacterized protein LOC116853080 isoform X2 n=1 Tax=Odontomachus brunneus TaxID=486640 RepID=UPI0013F21AA2|nr:uncharacterized protein LOC116853080 isoform X2 [Odontomachus brunneus]